MFRLFRFMKEKWYYAALAPLFMVVEVFCDLMQPTLMSQIVDVGVAGGDVPYIIATGLKMLGISAIGVLGGMFCTFASTFSAMDFGTRLRQAAFDHVQMLSFAEIDKLQTSSLITRLTNDITQMQNIVMMGLRMLVRAPLSCIGGIIMAYMLSPKLSVVLLVATPLLLVIVVTIMRKAFPLFSVMQEKIDGVNESMRESIMGMRVIKAFVAYDRVQKRFDKSNQDLVDISVKAMKIIILMFPVVGLVMNFSMVAVLYYGGYSAITFGDVTMGEVMAFLNYLTQILMSLVMVSMIAMNASRATASAKRINEIFDTKSSIDEKADAAVPTNFDIRFENVTFAYPGTGEAVLENINLDIPEGQSVGIIGATGSGKSSLVQLIPRLYDVTEGRLTVGGKNVKDLNLHALRENIGIVLQESILFQGTVEENLRWGKPDASDELVRDAAFDAQADEFIAKLSDGYASPVEQRGRNFSGGQKQRLSIARVLLKNPRVMILDDSTSALDLATEARLQSAVNEHKRGITQIIIAQRISSVQNADRIVVMDEGRICGVGTHDELLKQNTIYRAIVASQWGEEALTDVG